VLDTFDPVTEQPEPQRRPRWGRRIVAVLAAVALLLVAGVGAFLLFLNQTVSGNITREALLPSGEQAQALAPDGKPVPTDVGTNYLIIGTDARPGDTASRSDVIILAHVPEDGSKVYLVHFPRDLYVPIPGRGEDKINAAYAYGGAPLLVQTLQDLLGVRVDHVAKTDFEGFSRMTDAVGGVRVYAEEASTQGELVIRQGWNDLDGAEALAFVRERKQLSEGDISRGKRQQAFVKALMLKTLSRETLTSPVTLARFLDAATTNLVVDEDLSTTAMTREAFRLRGLRSDDIVFVTAPFSGFGRSPSGASIDVLDQAGMEQLGDALRTDDMASYTDATVAP
jgi:LCP family protein required for cell wall assembly